MKERPYISVVIPVRNEERLISDCLGALLAQQSQYSFEVIVADGLSTDSTKAQAENFGVKMVENPSVTAAAGRNIGIACARGEIIAFTDGDCVPNQGWIESIGQAFEDREVDAVAGRVLPCSTENHYEAFWNHLAWNVIMPQGPDKHGITKRELRQTLVTASCAYRRSLLERLGCFDEWFGNNAEDTDLTWRALAAGARLLYDPSISVFAHGPLTLKGVKGKSFRNGVSSSKLQKRYGGIINFDSMIYRLLFKSLREGGADARLNRSQLVWHLLGKYYGSIRYHVFNV